MHSTTRTAMAARSTLLAGFLGLALMGAARAAVTATGSGDTPLYATFELTLDAPGVDGNKFTKFATATLAKDGRTFAVDGFHDGGNTWRARFMPDATGAWTYTWSFEGDSGNGSFNCVAQTNDKIHGHVKRDPDRPRYLVYDDGAPHYFYGSMWYGFGNMTPDGKYPDGTTAPTTKGPYSQQLAYLDTLVQYKHNGTLLAVSLNPLNDDKASFDLPWLQHAEEWLKECAARGIYVQVGFFNTWARALGSYTTTTDGTLQVFNVWAAGDEVAKEFYLRYLVARFAGFYNIYWELGNEMGHSPNSGAAFVTQANEKYLPWIRKYDPYGLPIGLSEEVWKTANVDIGFLHQTESLPATSTDGNRPNIMNEQVRGGITGDLYKNEVIRNAANRIAYRRTLWRMFTYGGCGSSEATHLYLDTPLDQNVLNVMGDQRRLREFIEALPVHLNDTVTDTTFVAAGPGSHRTRRLAGKCYATYFLLDPTKSVAAGNVTLNLPAGNYRAQWYDPKTGAYDPATTVSSTGSAVTVPHPAFTEDAVLKIVSDELADATPPSAPADLGATAAMGRIDLAWTAAADPESGISGYRIYRGPASGEEVFLAETGTIPGYADTAVTTQTTYYYKVSAVNGMGLEGDRSNEANATAMGGETLTLTPIADTFVKYNDATAYGTEVSVHAKGATNYLRYGYLKFDTTSAPAGISQAKLRLTLKDTTAYWGAAGTGAVYEFTSNSWSEATVWGNRPGDSAKGASLGSLALPVSQDGTVWEVDVTNYILARRAAGQQTISFTVRSLVNNNSGLQVYSRESAMPPELVLVGSQDSQPPSIPQALVATAISPSQIDLAWDAAIDNVAVAGYDVFRDGIKVATVTGTSHGDTGLAAETAYSYEVETFDAAGNRSGKSAPASATTPALPVELAITNLVVASGKAYVADTLASGKLCYLDRSYTFSGVASLGGEKYIRTANADKASTGDAFLRFDINCEATVYLLWDRRVALPVWAAAWAPTGEVVATSDVVRDVYARDLPAGTVTLGGNGDATASSMYNVAVKAVSSGSPSTATAVAPGSVFAVTSGEAGVFQFTGRPRVWASYLDPLDLREKLATAKIRARIRKGEAANAVMAEWLKKVRLYDLKAFKGEQRLGTGAVAWLAANPIADLDLALHASGQEDGAKYAADLRSLALACPRLEAIEDAYGSDLSDPYALANQQILLRGRWFGSKPPKAWLEYPDPKTGAMKCLRLKPLKPYAFANGKPEASVMNPATSESRMLVQLPDELPAGVSALVIDNGVGLAARELEP